MVEMRSAVFVGMRQIKEPVSIVSKHRFRVVHTENVEKALRAIYIVSPDLIIANSSVENGEEGLFIKTVCSRFPELRSPVIMFLSEQTTGSLAIHEWNIKEGSYVARTGELGDLRDEIDRLCRPSSERLDVKPVPEKKSKPADPATPPKEEPKVVEEPISEENLTELRNIGFANTIKNDERSFHIQTEIITFGGVKIKTTVLEQGTVVDSLIHPVNGATGDIVAWAEETARKQHEGTVKNVRRGSYD